MTAPTTKLILHHTAEVHASDVNGVAFNKYTLATCSGDKTVRLLSLNDFSELPISPLQGHSYAIHCCAFASHGDILATCSTDGTCVLWNVITGTKVGTLFHPSKNSIRVCKFSPRATRLATGGSDEIVCLWDVESRKLLKSFDGHAASVTTCTFAPNGVFLVSGSTGGDIRVWDALYGHGKALTFQAEAHDMGVTCADFSPSYSEAASFNDTQLLLATGGFDNCVKLWHLCFAKTAASALTLLRVLEGHGAPLMSCCFSGSGSLLASGGVDKTIRLWDPNTGEQLCVEERHSRYVTCVAFSEDDRFLATASSDHLVNVWTVVSEKIPTGVSSVSELMTDVGHPAPVMSWSISDVCEWLTHRGMSQYVDTFRENAIDGTELLVLTDETLRTALNISALGHRNKILRLVKKLTEVTQVQSTHDIDGIPDEYLCPITRDIMKDPVIASDGYSYERAAISAWLDEGKRSSPMTNAPLAKLTLTSNHSLKMLIDRCLEQHPPVKQ